MKVDASGIAESVFREQSGRIIASLIRISGSFDAAEEAMQEALASALASWPVKGIPDNPGAWITAASHRKLIDGSRREQTRRNYASAVQHEMSGPGQFTEQESEESFLHLPDDRLRLIFTCCHPAINREGQIALTLRTLGGLTTGEIAKAFLLPESTLAQRLVRAKRKIQEARIPYQVPSAPSLPQRLASVQSVIYLIFNEGYTAMAGRNLVRGDLCAEAIRLMRALCELMQDEPENSGLLALMLLHDSRRNARELDGRLITLEEQDRSSWDRKEISEGLAILDRAIEAKRPGPYQLQAAISALHAQAASPQETDWAQITFLYERLASLQPTPVIALNHAVAVSMSDGFETGLRLIDRLATSNELSGYYLLHAARADILRRMGRLADSQAAYRKALDLTSNRMEREFLENRLSSIATHHTS